MYYGRAPPPSCNGPVNLRLASSMNTIAKHLTIQGRVQGVGYRHYIAYKARQFQITGWVRNRADGSVEAVISGTPEAVQAMLERAQRGPPAAAVTTIEIADSHETFERFETLPTM
jgi:acylphosphatase